MVANFKKGALLSIAVRIKPESFEVAGISQNVVGIIYFDFGNHQFPETGWYDFVVVILGWWLLALKKIALRTATSEKLEFMDGPVYIRVDRLDDSLCEIECISYGATEETIEHSGQYAMKDVIRAALRAADEAISICRQQGWKNDDTDALEAAMGEVALLESAHSKRRGEPPLH